jgi:predicted HicB family RNase H-like nuclease
VRKTSAAVKNRYNDKAYDRINLTVPKGQKDRIRAHAESQGEKVNTFIQRAINEAIARDKTDPEV